MLVKRVPPVGSYGGETMLALFDSVGECVREVRAAARKKGGLAFHPSFYPIDGNVWLGRGVAGWDQLEQIAGQFWADGMVAVETMLKLLDGSELPRPVARKRKRRFDECDGDEFQLDRFLSGQAHWEYRRRELVEGPGCITILSDVTASRGKSATDVLWRGAAACALAKLLEDAGYRVEMWTVRYAKGCFKVDGGAVYAAVRTKEAGDLLSIGEVVASVSAWFYRTALFAAANLDARGGDTGKPSAILEYAKEVTNDSRVVLVNGVWNLPDAVTFVKKSLNDLKIKQVPQGAT